MTEAVLDASVVLGWFAPEGDPGARAARAVRGRYERGELVVLAPVLLHQEIVNVAGRRWGWDEERLVALAVRLEDAGFEIHEPPLAGIAAWTARGLTAYDATYVALAEERRIELITADETILAVAQGVAVRA